MPSLPDMGEHMLKRPIKLEDADVKRPRLRPPQDPMGYHGQLLQDYTFGEPYLYEDCESVPRSPAYHPNNKDIKDLNKQALLKLCSHVKGSLDKDVEISRLSNKLFRLREIRTNCRLIVAYDGDTGSGKSTLISTLLSKLNLASEGNGSKSCTQVVAEYTDNPEVTNNYEAHVHLHSDELIETRIRAHVQNYRSFDKQHRAPVTDDSDDSLADDARTAIEWCQTLFCDRPECPSKDTIHDILMSGSVSEVVETLMLWIQDLKSKFDMQQGDDKIMLKASDVSELQKSASRFTDRLSTLDKRAMIWPIVDLVRFFIDSPFLRQGVELVDLPGLSDINVDRRNTSLAYLRDCCNAIIVVSKVTRAETLPSVQKSLKRAIRLKGANNVILVLTRIDDCTQNPDDLDRDEAVYLDKLEKSANKERNESKGKVPKERLAELKKTANQADASLKRGRILVGNRHLIHNFQEQYKELTGEKQLLRVVPVSNYVHQQYMAGFDEDEDDEIPCLGIHEDGIRNLRHEILHMLGDGKMQASERHVLRVRTAITSLQIWAQRSRNDRKELVMAMVREQLDRCGSEMPQHESVIVGTIKKEIYQLISTRLQDSWAKAIGRLVDGWGGKFGVASLKAFCRRNGVHKPKGHEVVSMTEHFLSVIEKDMDSLELQIKEQIDGCSNQLISYTEHILERIEKDFENEHNTAGIDMADLIKNLLFRKERLGHAINDFSNTLKEEIHGIMMKAQSEAAVEDDQYSPFVTALGQVYQQLTLIKGKNSKIRLLNQMKQNVTSGNGPFLKLATGLRNELVSALQRWVDSIDEYLRNGLKNVLLDLNRRFTGPEMPEEERSALRESLKLTLPQIEDVFETQIPLLIQGCREWA